MRKFGEAPLMLVWTPANLTELYEILIQLYEQGIRFPGMDAKAMHHFINRVITNNDHCLVQHFLGGGSFKLVAYRTGSLHIRFIGGKHNAK